MQHKCRVTVIDKKCYHDLQTKYLADPESGMCPFYNVGDEFIFERYDDKDDFWREGNGTQCAEAWDCISRYIYVALQGGSIMRNWTNDERIMIACCNDGTRPVIFKIERIDYKVLYIAGINNESDSKKISDSLMKIKGVESVNVKAKFTEVILRDKNISDEALINAVESARNYKVLTVD
ncbi:MAG: TIGR04076 family protein [Synergistaceae bacterium]|nr:TIGR04076 family protein [Synergistaceae bacterium]